MDVKNSGLVLAVCVAIGGAIALAAGASLLLYRPSAAGLAVSQPLLLPSRTGKSGEQSGIHSRAPGRPVLGVEDVRRIGRLEAQLQEKVALLNEKTALLDKAAAECRALRAELDQYARLAAELAADGAKDGEPGKPRHDAPADDPKGTAQQTEAQRLKEELNKTVLLEAALEMELSELRKELADAKEQVGEIQEEAERMIAVLLEEGSVSRDAAVKTLRRIGAPAVPALVELLRDEHAEARRWAAVMLTSIGPDAREALPALAEALSDSNEGVRVSARQAINAIRDEQPVP